jgi:hypothetical protein
MSPLRTVEGSRPAAIILSAKSCTWTREMSESFVPPNSSSRRSRIADS